MICKPSIAQLIDAFNASIILCVVRVIVPLMWVHAKLGSGRGQYILFPTLDVIVNTLYLMYPLISDKYGGSQILQKYARGRTVRPPTSLQMESSGFISSARHSPSGSLHNYLTAWRVTCNYCPKIQPLSETISSSQQHDHSFVITNHYHRFQCQAPLATQWSLIKGRPPHQRQCCQIDLLVSPSTLQESMMLFLHWTSASQITSKLQTWCYLQHRTAPDTRLLQQALSRCVVINAFASADDNEWQSELLTSLLSSIHVPMCHCKQR